MIDDTQNPMIDDRELERDDLDRYEAECLWIQDADEEFYSDPEQMIKTLGHPGLATMARELHAAAYEGRLTEQERNAKIADAFRYWADWAFCKWMDNQ